LTLMRKSANIGFRAKHKPRNQRLRAPRRHRKTRRPAAQQPVKFLTREQVETFFAQIPAENVRDLLLFDLMYRHGLRRGEAALIELGDLRDDEIWVWRLKGGDANWHPLHRRSKQLLRAYLQVRPPDPCGYLFRGRLRGAEPLTAGTISHLFQLYARPAGIPANLRHPHAMRHSCGTHLARAGWDLADVQWWLGHKDIESTKTYFHDMPARVAEKYKLLLRTRRLARTGDFN
jgi:integrase